MSRINDLIKRLCPSGVERNKLGEVGKFIRGNGLQKSDLTDAGTPAIHYGQIHTFYGTWTETTKSFTDPELATRLRCARPGDLVIATTSEDDAAVAKATAWLGDGEVAVSGDAYIYSHTLNPKYVAYFFQSTQFHNQKKRAITGTKVRRISGDNLAKLEIPVPPLAIQQEIVSILDKMEQLEARLEIELHAELRYRAHQYAYHRDTLITSVNAEVPWAPMGKVGKFIRGRRFTKADVVDVGVPAIHYGEIYTHYGVAADSTISHVREELTDQLRFADPGDVVIAAVGETVEDVAKAVAWVGDKPVAIHDDTFLFRSDLHPKFVSYFTQTANFHGQKNKYVARAKVKRLSSEGLAKIMIPLPTMDYQIRIVRILDRLDVLINDLTTAIPAEILTRRQQYEYYREHLLTFDEAAA